MLDILLAIMSFVAVVSIFCLCWLGWTLTEQLKNNDEVINRLQGEINALRLAHKAAASLRDKYEKDIIIKNNEINTLRDRNVKLGRKILNQ